MDIKEEELLGGAVTSHWYYRSKCLALDAMLRGIAFRQVLDIGAGSAIFSRHLLDGGAQSALCIDPAYAADRVEEYNEKPIRFARQIGKADADLILLMDVLEHVDDDAGLVRASLAGAAPGAHVLISVPAFQSLYSAHDRFLEHRRRYTIATLDAVVAAAGLKTLSVCYFFGLILPLAAAVRFAQRNRQPRSSLAMHPRVVNDALALLHRIEIPFFRYNRLGGLSVFCLARAP